MATSKERKKPPLRLYVIVVFTLFFLIPIIIILFFNLPWYFPFHTLLGTPYYYPSPTLWIWYSLFPNLWVWYSLFPPLWGMPYYYPLLTPWGTMIGLILLAFGFSTEVSALRVLRISRAFGEEIYESKTKSKLITTGIYAHTRNPVYLGATILFLGWFFITLFTFLLITTSLFIVLFIFTAKWEEKELTERFGKDYLQYKETVPLFIPYPKRMRRKNRQRKRK